MKIILTRGLCATVDNQDSDLDMLKWFAGSHGYAVRDHRIDGKPRRIYLHRIILRRKMGKPLPDGHQVDHKNGDRLDCRRVNLRAATIQEQRRNRFGIGGASPYKGVARVKNKLNPWRAYINLLDKQIHLGCHATQEDAARVYDQAAYEHFGEFAKLNFP